MGIRIAACLMLCAVVAASDAPAQSALYQADIRNAAAALREVRESVASGRLAYSGHSQEGAAFVESSRVDLVYAIDEVVGALTMLDDRLVGGADPERRIAVAQRAAKRVDQLVRRAETLEGALRQVRGETDLQDQAARLLGAAEEIRALAPGMLMALDGYAR